MGRKKMPAAAAMGKVRSAARQQVGKLYIIAACVALLVCGGGGGGCTSHKTP
ncbi:hypothetical protein ACP4OV_014185 [Aristida adscensionis]